MNELYVIEAEASDWEEAIRLTAKVLIDQKAVKLDFAQSCIEREKEYPTGLNDQCPIAIPHTTSSHVNRDAIILLRLKHAVPFHSMEDMDKVVNCRYVMNLALVDDKTHIHFLSKLFNAFKDPNCIKKMDGCSNSELQKLMIKIIN